MSIVVKKKRKSSRFAGKTGLSPGTPFFLGDRKREKARIDVLDYSETSLNEQHDISVDQCRELTSAPGVIWINVKGIHDTGLIEALGECFGLHPLTLEDIVNTTHRPKAEEFSNYIFIVLKTVALNKAANRVDIEQVSVVLGENFVVSFLEGEGDVFETVRERIRSGKGRVRSMKADYLAYALMDTVVDHYFLAVEGIGDRIEEIDEQILIEPEPENIQEIHQLKRDILSLRKAVWPLREEIGVLEKSESTLVHPDTRVFWRDLYDHTIQIMDMVETFRDILGWMHDTYLSSISNRMNEVMQVLTIIATIFIPLTFIVGVYGMNFEYMPELKWPWGYPLVWGGMLAIALGLLWYFKKKKWM